MSGTRAREIRGNIADTLTGVTLDHRASTADKMQHLDVPRRPDSARERTFRVIIAAQPTKGRHNTCDDYETEFTIEAYWSLGPGVEHRIAEDHERFMPELDRLMSVNAWILHVVVSPLGVEETHNNYIARVSVIVSYRLDSTLL